MKTLDIVFQKPFFPMYDVLSHRFPGNENGNTTGADEDPDEDDKPTPDRPGGGGNG